MLLGISSIFHIPLANQTSLKHDMVAPANNVRQSAYLATHAHVPFELIEVVGANRTRKLADQGAGNLKYCLASQACEPALEGHG